MTLPLSGSISTAQIRAEIGGSGAVTIPSTEVRTLTGVSTGPITLPNDFWGKSGAGGADQTPAAVDWANITTTTPPGANADKTISSINTMITLQLASSSVSGTSAMGIQNIYVNGVSVATHTPGGAATTFAVNNGDTVHFDADATGSSKTKLWISTITNLSDGGATLDTFTNTVTTTP